eukprot:5708-Chlamydomonas_euryale.AAC.2
MEGDEASASKPITPTPKPCPQMGRARNGRRRDMRVQGVEHYAGLGVNVRAAPADGRVLNHPRSVGVHRPHRDAPAV